MTKKYIIMMCINYSDFKSGNKELPPYSVNINNFFTIKASFPI